MTRRRRRNDFRAFKTNVSLLSVRGDKTIAEIAQQFEVHPNQVADWRRQLLERVAGGREGIARQDRAANTGVRFFARSTRQGGIAERKAMIDRTHRSPVTRQAELVGISRGIGYYRPEPIPGSDLRLMHRIDELHFERPFGDSRMLRDLLRPEGWEIGRQHVGRLMRRMDIEALYRKPNTSRKHPGHPGLYVPATGPANRARQSGLGHGRDVHPDGPWLLVRDGGDGLAQPPCASASRVDHDGRRALRGRARRGNHAERRARDHERRPR